MKRMPKIFLTGRIFFQSFVLIGLSCILAGLTVDRTSPRPYSAIDAEVENSVIPAMGLQQAKVFVASGQGVCVDVRKSAEFKKGHLPGAISLPYDDLDRSISNNLSLFTGDKQLLVYCGGVGCDWGVIVGRRMAALGLSSISILPDGWAGWKDAGFPTEQ